MFSIPHSLITSQNAHFRLPVLITPPKKIICVFILNICKNRVAVFLSHYECISRNISLWCTPVVSGEVYFTKSHMNYVHLNVSLTSNGGIQFVSDTHCTLNSQYNNTKFSAICWIIRCWMWWHWVHRIKQSIPGLIVESHKILYKNPY